MKRSLSSKGMYFLFTLLFHLWIIYPLFSQSNISGIILNDKGVPVEFANVILLTQQDSTFISGTTSDLEGKFLLELDSNVNRIIKISSLGFDEKYLELDPSLERYEIVIKSSSYNLDEVVVKGRKVLFELKQDRMVLNVEASPALSGNTALQVLQKSPGVIVNRQGNSISMNAKGEVLVMINDKIQRVPKSVLLAQLEGMPAENIEKIELIHQPSARYDASGAAGIINIVLKKNTRNGLNGNFSLMAGYGQKEKAGTTIGVNYRKGLINIYGDYNFNWHRADQYTVDHFRAYDYLGDDFYYENLVELEEFKAERHAASFGVDVELKNKAIVGLLFNYANAKDIYNSSSQSFSYFNNSLDDSFEFQLFPQTITESFFSNLNFFQPLTERSHLNFDFDYVGVKFNNRGDISSGQNSADEFIRASRYTPVDIMTLKADYINNLNDNSKIELGFKGTFSKVTSTAVVENTNNSQWIGSTLFSGTDEINERILAGYISYSHNFSKKLNGEIGLRYEFFEYDLNAEEAVNDLNQVFNNPFPIIRFNYKADSLNTLQFTFNRTINRPSFSNLSAFFIFLDPSILVFGNPQLRPAFTNTYKVSWQRRAVILSLSYSDAKNSVYFYNRIDKENALQLSSPNNLDQNHIFETNLSFPIYIGDRWEMNWNLNGLFQTVKAERGRVIPYEDEIFTYSIQFNNSVRLGKDWTASIDGRYLSDFLYGDQVQFLHPFINLGVRKQFPNGSSLSFSFQDITNTIGKNEWEYNQPELGARTFGNNNFSERQIRVTYAATFGNQKISKKRARNTGAQEEKNRM